MFDFEQWQVMVFVVTEIDGLEEGLRRHDSEHGERGGSEDNGVGKKSNQVSAGAGCCERRGPAHDASA